MLVRIVRMEFKPEKVREFLEIFENSHSRIENFEGCELVKLYTDVQDKNVYYTHSLWHSEDALNAYRTSSFFRETWSKTKLLFSAKPAAFSLIDPVSSQL